VLGSQDVDVGGYRCTGSAQVPLLKFLYSSSYIAGVLAGGSLCDVFTLSNLISRDSSAS